MSRARDLAVYWPPFILGVIVPFVPFISIVANMRTLNCEEPCPQGVVDVAWAVWGGLPLIVVGPLAGGLCAGWQSRSSSRNRAPFMGVAGLAVLPAVILGWGVLASDAPLEAAVAALLFFPFVWAVLAVPFLLGWGVVLAILGLVRPATSQTVDVWQCASCGARLWGPWYSSNKGGYVCRRCGAVTPRKSLAVPEDRGHEPVEAGDPLDEQ